MDNYGLAAHSFETHSTAKFFMNKVISAEQQTSELATRLSNTMGMFLLFFSVIVIIVLYKIVYLLNSDEGIFWYFYSILTGFFLLSRLPLGYFYHDSHARSAGPARDYPGISFIIAGKNEEDSIYATIESCMRSDYPGPVECIVVNDGSTDGTEAEMQRAVDYYNGYVRLISFAHNRGKREGMAVGVIESTHDIIVFVDSDSFPEPNAVRILVEHFMDNPEVGAVSGNSGVENERANLLAKMQASRYAISFDIFKSAESLFGAVTCCPGCFSAYRRTAVAPVLEAWRNQMFLGTRSTFGDDRSLTNFVLRTWRVEYCRSARATTIVPEKYMKFMKQQIRWKKSWIREGITAAKFMWRKHPIAAVSFYTNLLLPIFGPLLVARILYMSFVAGKPETFLVFVAGTSLMGIAFAAFLNLYERKKYWYCMPLFSLLYALILVWQMPYALFRINDTRWGTR